jgi:hypothetical protein
LRKMSSRRSPRFQVSVPWAQASRKPAACCDCGELPHGDSVRNQPVSGGNINVEAELASVAVGEAAGCSPDTPGAAPARHRRRGANGGVRDSTATTWEGAPQVQPARQVAYWPADLCVLVAILLQVGLSHRLTVGPRWLLPALEGFLLIGLAATTPYGHIREDHPVRRRVAIGLIAVVNAANAISLYLLAHELLNEHISNGRALILSGIAIWLTNVLIFALWYWQLDRGGPADRAKRLDPHTPEGRPDFVFAQMDSGRPYTPDDWMPEFLDYLALGVTTATAFSAADTLPISRQAKALMSAQALISLVTLGLIISRAVGILS